MEIPGLGGARCRKTSLCLVKTQSLDSDASRAIVMNPPEDVAKEGLAEIFGAGPPVRWERPLLFLAAWFLSDVAVQPFVLIPVTSETWEWFFTPPSPWSVAATFSTGLVLTAVAFVVLMFVRQVFLAVPVLALVSALVSRPVSVFFRKLSLAQFSPEDAATLPWFDLAPVGRVALSLFLVFLGLALGLRFLKSRWLGLLVGATGGALVAALRSAAMMAFVESDASGVAFFLAFFFMGRAVAEVIVFALLLIAALAIAEPLKEEPRVRRGFYVGTPLGSFALSAIFSVTVIVMITADLGVVEDQLLPVVLSLLFATALLVLGAIVVMVLIHKMWASIQDGHARTTPGRAVGFLFIPFFSLYWIFPAFWGFAKDYNAFTLRHGLKDAPTLSPGLFLAYSLLLLAGVVPLVGVLSVPVAFVVGIVMISRICDAVNAVPEQVEPAGQIL